MSNSYFPVGATGGGSLVGFRPPIDGPDDWRNPKDPPKGNGLPIPVRAPTLNLEQTCPGIVNLFILSQENDGTLTNANLALKRNLKNYLLDLKMLTDKVIIRNAFVINISLLDMSLNATNL